MRTMKDSGVEWIGEIPEDWTLLRFKDTYYNSNGGEVIDKNHWGDGDETLYTCKKESMLSSYKCFPEHKRTKIRDLLLTRNATPYIFEPKEGSIYSNVVQRVTVFEKYNISFVKQCLQLGIENLVVNGDIIPSYNMSVWNSLIIPCNDKDQQEKISNYLDEKCSIIDSIIANTKQSIEDYKKYKQAIITEAVTKGLDKDVKLKDSGVEWIGEIPEEWATKKVKNVITTNRETLKETTNKNTILKYLDISSVGYMMQLDQPKEYTFEKAPSRARRIVKYGDMILSTVRPYLKTMLSINEDNKDVIVSTGFAVLTPKPEIYMGLLKYIISNEYFINTINANATGVAYPAINENILQNITIPLPPLHEQIEIVNYLDTKCQSIDTLIENKQRLLSEMEAYKKSLIFECVTGKKEIK